MDMIKYTAYINCRMYVVHIWILTIILSTFLCLKNCDKMGGLGGGTKEL